MAKTNPSTTTADPVNEHLKEEVAAVYEIINWPTNSPAQVFGKFGKIDLTKLSLKQAENLVKRKFPKIKKK